MHDHAAQQRASKIADSFIGNMVYIFWLILIEKIKGELIWQ